jgi:hypothetical protein
MKGQTAPTVIQILILAILVFAIFRPEEKVVQGVQKWEYAVDAIPDLEWETKGKQVGEAGWDMVTCRRASGGDGNFSYECIFKRPIVE